jgi:hypothetical protein
MRRLTGFVVALRWERHAGEVVDGTVPCIAAPVEHGPVGGGTVV